MPERIIDADGHVRERDEALVDYLEGRYKDLMHDPTHAFFPSVTSSTNALRDPHIHTRHSVELGGQEWLPVLDELGIEQTVLYPTSALGHGEIRDPEWACASARAYNRWVHDTYCRVSPRLKAVALLPMQDPSAAAAELSYAVTELGMVGGMLCAGNSRNCAYGNVEFDPVWGEAERLDVPLALHAHTGETHWASLHLYDTKGAKIHAVAHPMKNLVQLTSIIMDGVFERFPGARVACLESGSGWVAWLMDRLDYEAHRSFRSRGVRHLQRSPSEYIREHVYVSCDPSEALLPASIERLGVERFLFASDFPHDAPAWIHEDLDEWRERTDLAPETKALIMGENAARFYRLAPIPTT